MATKKIIEPESVYDHKAGINICSSASGSQNGKINATINENLRLTDLTTASVTSLNPGFFHLKWLPVAKVPFLSHDT
jgi:hypothetical protein